MRALCAGLLMLLGGCASQPVQTSQPAASNNHWQGRLAVKVYSKPVQAFSANFELDGSPAKGVLVLSSPLGTTLARMQWEEGREGFATLSAHGEQRDFGSLQELAMKATGADLPVTTLFAWLQGQADQVPGWQVDLSELPAGRIQAKHPEEVQSELKIILDR